MQTQHSTLATDHRKYVFDVMYDTFCTSSAAASCAGGRQNCTAAHPAEMVEVSLELMHFAS